MRRQKLMVILLAMTTLTGCIQKYEYTEEQTDAAAEFMAGLLLKSDDRYKADLLTVDEIMENQAGAVTVTPIPGTSPGGVDNQEDTGLSPIEGEKPQKEYTLSEVIGEKGFSLEYTSYIIAESYPEDPAETYFSITPRKGNQLIVLSFMLTNELKKNNNLNLTQADIKYQLYINSKSVYEPPFALLENNLKLIDITLREGEVKPVVLIFEVEKDMEMKDISLKVTREKRSEVIEIKKQV